MNLHVSREKILLTALTTWLFVSIIIPNWMLTQAPVWITKQRQFLLICPLVMVCTNWKHKSFVCTSVHLPASLKFRNYWTSLMTFGIDSLPVKEVLRAYF
jgi:hypothetical protein